MQSYRCNKEESVVTGFAIRVTQSLGEHQAASALVIQSRRSEDAYDVETSTGDNAVHYRTGKPSYPTDPLNGIGISAVRLPARIP